VGSYLLLENCDYFIYWHDFMGKLSTDTFCVNTVGG